MREITKRAVPAQSVWRPDSPQAPIRADRIRLLLSCKQKLAREFLGFETHSEISHTTTMICRRGGIGRRAGLKIQWPQGRVGSSPSAGNEFSIQCSMSDVERPTAIDLSFGAVIWEKTLPDCFIRVASFAFRIPLSHRFQCKQRAIASRVERAHRAGDVSQP